MTVYRIQHHLQEAQCERCGWPLYLGDRARLTKWDRIACSVRCAKALNQEDKRRGTS